MAVTTARLPGVTFETRMPSVPSPLPRMDVAAFVGFAASGPINVPVPVDEPTRFHDIFGEDLPLAVDDRTRQPVYAELPAAVRGFFRNGGARCWVVRVAGPSAATDRFLVPGLLRTTPDAPGVGAALVHESEAEARRRGYRGMMLHARDIAVGFYERLGYGRIGEPFVEVGIPHQEMGKSMD